MSAGEIASRYGVETDPHALNDVVLRKTLPVGARAVDITGIVEPSSTDTPRRSERTGGCSGATRREASRSSG